MLRIECFVEHVIFVTMHCKVYIGFAFCGGEGLVVTMQYFLIILTGVTGNLTSHIYE